MKKITKEELEVFLRKHKLWLENKEGGERADLQGADLQGADLRRADLQGADLRGADLQGADLRGADLQGAENIFVPLTCPEEGEFIGFKKARGGYIVKLKITEDAKRSSSTGRKCRCSKAVVLSITTLGGENDGTMEIASSYDSSFVYKVGETVEVKDFCDDRFDECAPGIHFFINRKEAEDHYF